MAHGLIEQTAFEDLADHLAYIWGRRNEIGPSGLPLYTLITGLDNADLDAVNLDDICRRLDQRLEGAEFFNTLFTDAFNALQRHLAAAGVTETEKELYETLDAYLVGEDIRVHVDFAEAHYRAMGEVARLTKSQVFDRSGIALGTLNWTGAGTGTFAAGDTTDEVLTGGNSVIWRIPAGKVVNNGVVDLTFRTPDGASVVQEGVTIDGEAGDTGEIGIHFDDLYVELEGASFESGGGDGEQAVIETVCDRDPATA